MNVIAAMPRAMTNPGALLLSLLVATLLLYGATASGLFRLWTSPDTVTYGHGLLLLAIALFLGYRNWRRADPATHFHPSIVGLVLLSSLSVLWFLAGLGSVQVVQQVVLVALPVGIAWAAFGYAAARRLFLPVLLVLCAVPVWEILNQGQLQELNAFFVSKLVALSGVSIYREGILLTVPAGSFLVAENCSGMRQLMVAIPIGLLYAWMNGFGPLLSTLYTAVAAVVAVLVNIVRVYIIVMAGQMTGMQHYFVTTDHITLGWALFGIGMLALIFLSNRLLPPRKGAIAGGGGSSPVEDARLPASGAPSLQLKGAVFAVIGLAAGPALTGWYAGDADQAVTARLELPARMGAWEAAAHDDDYRPRVQGEDAAFEVKYRHPNGNQVSLHVYYFHRQDQGREAVSTFNRVDDGQRWRATGRAAWHRLGDQGLLISAQELSGPGGRKKLVWHWYEAARGSTADRNMAKLYGVLGRLTGRPDAAMIVLSTDIEPREADAERSMTKFTEVLLPQLKPALQRAALSVHENH